jgi:hypothetical protein
MSACAPEGIAKARTGRFVAAWTNEIIRAEADSSVIGYASATFCIQVPMFEPNETIQSQQNSGRASGANVFGPPRVAAVFERARAKTIPSPASRLVTAGEPP